MKKALKQKKGITLIALVVTIIVLLLLAGISVMMLTGNNGILNRVGQAKEETEMAQLKEQAELVRNSMLIDKTVNGTGDLTRNALVAGIASDSYFKGSTRSGYKVVTADEKYDVKVGNDLSITVEKHVATVGKEITLTLTEEETESRAIILKVTATIEGVEELTTTSLEDELDPDRNGNTPELQNMFLKAVNKLYDSPAISSWSELEENFGPITPSNVFEMIKPGLPNAGYTSTDMYSFIIETGVYKPDITLICTNENKEEIGKITVAESGEFVVLLNGLYTVTASDDDGDYGKNNITISKCVNRRDNKVEKFKTKEAKAEQDKNSETITDLEDNSVEVPAGFYYGISENIGKVSIGFVITDSVDSNGNSTGNEFVWIPIDKETLKVIGADGVNIDKVIARPSTDSEGNTNYEGVLYDFHETGGEISSSELTIDDINYYHKEPALVRALDNDTSKIYGREQTYLGQIGLTADQFEKEMIENYNAMINSIQTYGGFYVARYEMGVKDSTVVISKLGVTPADAFDETTEFWYGLYSKAKTYVTSSVKSSMIWGSQYDAILHFALAGLDKTKVIETTNGNHGKTTTKTGAYKGSDCINNIYDLEGNGREWTLEASGMLGNNNLDCYRVVRGGGFNDDREMSPSIRYGIMAKAGGKDSFSDWGYCTRVTLYIR